MAKQRSPWRGPLILGGVGAAMAAFAGAAAFALAAALTNDASWLATEPFASGVEALGFERPEGDGGSSLGSLLLLALAAGVTGFGLLLVGAAMVWAVIVAARRPEVKRAAECGVAGSRKAGTQARERARELRDGRSDADL